MKIKNCDNKGCENTFNQFNSLQRYCCLDCKKKSINSESKKKIYVINKKSKKRQKEEIIYFKKRAEFLNKKENKKCAVFPSLHTTDVHHKKGRIGYADDISRLNGISLYLDERFWLAVSRKGHDKIENNPKWAKENGYSLDRLS